MPWSFKAVLAAFGLVCIGGVLIGLAFIAAGWESLTYLAYGVVTSGVGLFLVFLFSVICAITRPEWRTRSWMLASIAVFLAAALYLFAKAA